MAPEGLAATTAATDERSFFTLATTAAGAGAAAPLFLDSSVILQRNLYRRYTYRAYVALF